MARTPRSIAADMAALRRLIRRYGAAAVALTALRETPVPLVFDIKVFAAALKDPDELTREIARLISRFDDDAVIATAIDLKSRLWKPEKPAKSPGRPPEWADEGKIFCWLAVEAQWRADKRSNPRISLSASIQNKFKRLPRRGSGAWRVVTDLGSGRGNLDIKTVESARKYHRAGQRLIAASPDHVRALWKSRADMVAASITRKVGKK